MDFLSARSALTEVDDGKREVCLNASSAGRMSDDTGPCSAQAESLAEIDNDSRKLV